MIKTEGLTDILAASSTKVQAVGVKGFTFFSKVLNLWCCDLYQYCGFHTTLGVDFKGWSRIWMKNMAAAIKQSLLSGIRRKMIPQMAVFGHMILYCAQNFLVGSYKQNVEALELAQSKMYPMGMLVPAPYYYMDDFFVDCILLGCAFILVPVSMFLIGIWTPSSCL